MEDMERLEAMKAVILAGGMGTRISEESQWKPKPMIEIGGYPILWHIMKIYSSYGVNEFIICCGYKGDMIKQYFIDYAKYQNDVSFNLKTETRVQYGDGVEPWKVTLVSTGLKTLTAGRILKIREYVGNYPFFLTYGDGVSDIDIKELYLFHKRSNNTVTISTVQPEGRFGAIKIDSASRKVISFKEKARKDQSWINMGFMVMEPDVFDYLGDGDEMLEAEPFERLASIGRMGAYKHNGFWSPMDTMRDREYLEGLWESGLAPWNLWK